jgi:hypothetical protein
MIDPGLVGDRTGDKPVKKRVDKRCNILPVRGEDRCIGLPPALVDRVLTSAGQSVRSDTREKVENYIDLLASTGKSPKQLVRYGKAYLREMLKADPRYSGC